MLHGNIDFWGLLCYNYLINQQKGWCNMERKPLTYEKPKVGKVTPGSVRIHGRSPWEHVKVSERKGMPEGTTVLSHDVLLDPKALRESED